MLTVTALLVVCAFVTAVFSLAGRVHAAVPALLLALLEAMRILPVGK